MKITKHAQSCFLIETADARVLIDPGFYVFSDEGLKPEDFQNITAIVVTHIHEDHADMDAIRAIVKNNSPALFGPEEVIEKIKEFVGEYVPKELPAEVQIQSYVSKHGPLPSGEEPPEVKGFVVSDKTMRFYTPGDSIALNPEAKADIIATPICGTVVMDIGQAKEELMRDKPKLAIPMHYDNPRFPVDVKDFVAVMEGTNIPIKVLTNGESFESDNIE